MKNRLHLFLAIGLLLTVTTVQAQFKIGPKAGLNFSTMHYTISGESLDDKMLTGYHIGVVAEIPLAKHFVLQPSVLLSTKGSEISDSYNTVTISPTYIEIPINALYKIDLGSAKLLLFAGPYVAFGASGEVKVGDLKKDIKWGSSEDSQLERADYGVNFGAGIEINNFQLTAQYGVGLTNVIPSYYKDEEVKNRVIGISVAYLFGGK